MSDNLDVVVGKLDIKMENLQKNCSEKHKQIDEHLKDSPIHREKIIVLEQLVKTHETTIGEIKRNGWRIGIIGGLIGGLISQLTPEAFKWIIDVLLH